MTNVKTDTKIHPTEIELADYLSRGITGENKIRIEDHIACCPECLESIVSAYESVKIFNKGRNFKKGKGDFMKKLNVYLILAAISFILSFITPQYFIQLLVATTLLGIKWIVDAKSTKMLVMIYEAWKKGGEKEASRILSALDSNPKNRL
ncbi:MAG: zf-HC2 domain-containing protein [Candidatus Omnitrophota bacterium]|nr:zf-HC2 domain-containing protein [Candidatus Omnitrophota bacterium]